MSCRVIFFFFFFFSLLHQLATWRRTPAQPAGMTAFALFELPKPALAAILSALDSQDRCVIDRHSTIHQPMRSTCVLPPFPPPPPPPPRRRTNASRAPCCRERLPHVCHAWHSGFYKEPLCNRQLSVHVSKLARSKDWLAALAARAPHAEMLTLHWGSPASRH